MTITVQHLSKQQHRADARAEGTTHRGFDAARPLPAPGPRLVGQQWPHARTRSAGMARAADRACRRSAAPPLRARGDVILAGFDGNPRSEALQRRHVRGRKDARRWNAWARSPNMMCEPTKSSAARDQHAHHPAFAVENQAAGLSDLRSPSLADYSLSAIQVPALPMAPVSSKAA
jgi:hypothetical protein